MGDVCAIATGDSADVDENGIPDECELACPEDTNRDGLVDVRDLVAIILAWGTAEKNADVNGDCIVDLFDLAGR